MTNGYTPVRNEDAASDRLRRMGGKRQVIYVRSNPTIRDRLCKAEGAMSRREPISEREVTRPTAPAPPAVLR